MNILVTGSQGFIGKNLISWLKRDANHCIYSLGRDDSWSTIEQGLAVADIVFHLAGVNRPQTEAEFYSGNVEFTKQLCNALLRTGRSVPLVISSSVQATLDNPYGVSKRQAEEIVGQYAAQSGAHVSVYRLQNVFGKWCRPNYNSVVATFCYNIAHDLPITIADSSRELTLVHIDDVLRCFLAEIEEIPVRGVSYRTVKPAYQVTLGRLAELIHAFRQIRQTLHIPNLNDEFTHKLYSTYLTYLESDNFAYPLEKKCDARGCLAEFVKSAPFGQIFVSRTHPGVTRGNHYHHLKTEKFLVLEGKAIIRFRPILGGDIIEHPICGEDFHVVDIPPGYTHSIENVGSSELITLFWASEIFDPTRADTTALSVLP